MEARSLQTFGDTNWWGCTASAKDQISLPGLRVLRAFVVAREWIRLSLLLGVVPRLLPGSHAAFDVEDSLEAEACEFGAGDRSA